MPEPCHKCCGLMVSEEMIDLDSTFSESRVSASRCVSCGRRTDPVMEMNRASPQINPCSGGNRLLMHTFKERQALKARAKKRIAEV